MTASNEARELAEKILAMRDDGGTVFQFEAKPVARALLDAYARIGTIEPLLQRLYTLVTCPSFQNTKMRFIATGLLEEVNTAFTPPTPNAGQEEGEGRL